MHVLILRPYRKDNIYFRTIEEREKIRVNICCTTTKCGLFYHITLTFCSCCFNMFKVDITSTFCSLQYHYLQMSWTGLEGMSDGYALNKSTMDSY